ncbi:MAG: hypothetical protein K0R84_2286 [Clostridia bacterium]|jgi:hypothetical protein|nr:hypothetical protein [Clostridia bacterium]
MCPPVLQYNFRQILYHVVYRLEADKYVVAGFHAGPGLLMA